MVDLREQFPDHLEPVGVVAALAQEAVENLSLAHVVLVDDPYLDAPMVVGPFPGPVSAASFADQFRRDLRYEGCEASVAITVVPLQVP